MPLDSLADAQSERWRNAPTFSDDDGRVFQVVDLAEDEAAEIEELAKIASLLGWRPPTTSKVPLIPMNIRRGGVGRRDWRRSYFRVGAACRSRPVRRARPRDRRARSRARARSPGRRAGDPEPAERVAGHPRGTSQIVRRSA